MGNPGSSRTVYLELHVAVILLAFTAILGDWITLPAGALVWWRTLLAALGVGMFLLLRRSLRWDWLRTKKKIYVLGAMIGIHWICFFGSVKLANASMALITFATMSFFTAWIEPAITGRPRQRHEVIFGLLIIPGVALIAGQATGDLMAGFVLGVLAAALMAVAASFQKKWIAEIDPLHMTFMQMTGAWGAMCLWIGGETLAGGSGFVVPGLRDFIALLVLAWICTGIAWVLAARAIRHMTAFDALMAINLEPVYGMAMAALLLGDQRELNISFYIGAGMILAVVFLHPIWTARHVAKRT
jgi:drug/metabolite transporter (DMT)-like permease